MLASKQLGARLTHELWTDDVPSLWTGTVGGRYSSNLSSGGHLLPLQKRVLETRGSEAAKCRGLWTHLAEGRGLHDDTDGLVVGDQAHVSGAVPEVAADVEHRRHLAAAPRARKGALRLRRQKETSGLVGGLVQALCLFACLTETA